MRRHPALGYEILKGIDFLGPRPSDPAHHQERFDGTGYPRAQGRRHLHRRPHLRVVDTYDAITNDRPYRKCQTYEVARGEIVKCAGTQLDPAVVHAWLRIPQAEWDAIREEIERGGR